MSRRALLTLPLGPSKRPAPFAFLVLFSFAACFGLASLSGAALAVTTVRLGGAESGKHGGVVARARSRPASPRSRGRRLGISQGGATSVTVGDLVGSAEADGTNVVHVTLTEAVPHGDPSSANWLFLVCPFKGNGPTSGPTVTDSAVVGPPYSQANMIRLPQGVTGVYPFLPNPFGVAVLPYLVLNSLQVGDVVTVTMPGASLTRLICNAHFMSGLAADNPTGPVQGGNFTTLVSPLDTNKTGSDSTGAGSVWSDFELLAGGIAPACTPTCLSWDPGVGGPSLQEQFHITDTVGYGAYAFEQFGASTVTSAETFHFPGTRSFDQFGAAVYHAGAGWPYPSTSQSSGCLDGTGAQALCGSGTLGDDVNTLTGAFVTSETDLSLASIGLPFQFTRSYTSSDSTAGRLGVGWTDSYSAALLVQRNGDVILHGEDGQQVYYTKQADGSFVGAAGARSILTSVTGGYKLVRHDQVVYQFNGSGVLQSMVDRNGQGLTFGYDGSGRLSTITDAAGHIVSLGYNASNLVSTVSTPDGRTVSYGYTNGRLTSVTLPDPDGGGPLPAPVIQYSYDPTCGLLTSELDPNNHTVVSNVYDCPSGRVTQQTDADGKITHFAWDDPTQTATVTDPDGHVWKDVYSNNVLIKRISGGGDVTQLGHDSDLNTNSVTSPNGTDTTSLSYQNGNLTSATAPASLGSGQKTLTYDAQNNVKTVTDALGKLTQYGYDASGNLTSITVDGQQVFGATYNAQGEMLTSTDGNQKQTTYTYDPSGNVASVTDPLGDKTTYTYNAFGEVLTKVMPLGNCSGCTQSQYTTTYAYDAEGRLLTETDPLGHTTTNHYDVAGNRDWTQDANGHRTTFGYDNANRLVQMTEPDPDGAGPLPAPVTTYTYDDAGNRVTEVDPRGNVPGCNCAAQYTTTYTYDANNRLASMTTPKGEKTTYTYDPNGNLATVVDPRGNVAGCNCAAQYTTPYTYDAAGRLLTTTDPLGHVTTNHYDAVGNLDWTKDANNHQTSFGYDAQGRILSVTAPDPDGGGPLTAPVTQYSYDGNGSVKTRTDANLHATTYDYDDAGRLIRITGPGSSPPITTYTYDFDGNLKTKTDANGNCTGCNAAAHTTTYSYDRADRLTGTSYGDGTTPAVTLVLDPVGSRSSMTDGSGTVNYTYDNLDRVTAITRGTNTFNYGYDVDGNVTSRTYPDSTQATYSYDEDNRLASVASGGATTSYAYDPASHLIQTTLPSGNGYVETRTYDAAGRLTEVKNAKAAFVLSDFVSTLDPVGNPSQIVQTGAVSSTTTYGYDNDDRLMSVCFQAGSCPGSSDPFIRWTYDGVGNRLTEARPGVSTKNYTYNALDELTQAGSTTYTYDQNGNEKTAGSTTYTYDLANRMKTLTSGSTTTTYTYDGDGIRLQASTGPQASKKTNYLWDTNNQLPELALERDGSNSLLRRYIYGTDRVSMTSGGSNYYYHYDALGSVRNVTSSTGVTQWTDTYEPFGPIRTETKNGNQAPANFMKFAGEYLDPTGLYDLRARQYDPTLGRFTVPDPVDVAVGVPVPSSYAYVGDRPTVMVDPSGTTLVASDRALSAADSTTSRACAQGVDRGRVVWYLRHWAYSTNPKYGRESTLLHGENDCTNFISQSLHFGCWKETKVWNVTSEPTCAIDPFTGIGGCFGTHSVFSTAWINVKAFIAFAQSSGRATLMPTMADAQLGDVVVIAQHGGIPASAHADHLVGITGFAGPQILISSHGNDHRDFPLYNLDPTVDSIQRRKPDSTFQLLHLR